jgi:chemotaxis protein methyltransferase CheR
VCATPIPMSAPELSLTPQVFAILSGLVEDRIGIAYSLSDKPIFEGKVAARAAEAGFESMLDYYYYLRYDDPERTEFQALVEVLVVNETFFFRELEPLRVALTHFVAPVVAAGRRARVWFAACATGEEPVTAAMLLDDAGILPQVELVASDISERALAHARRGLYRPRALRVHARHPLAARYLTPSGQDLKVAEHLHAAIDYRRLNLTEPETLMALGTFDLVICRNVLIYFRDDRARDVVRSLAQRVSRDGALLVGVSESLMRFGVGLECEEHAGVFVYRRRG